jgi:NAD-dependent deacetylase
MLPVELIQQTAEQIRSSRHTVVLSGSGVSRESGIPTFRDAMEGLWARFDPQQLATPEAFQADPKLVWDWYEYRRELVRTAQPNPGHYALSELERRYPNMRIITQNVDDLHERAGSQNVIHLHGNIAQSKCFDDCQGDPTLVDLSAISWDSDSGPPPCPHCGRWVRPNVVWVGEMLPETQLEAAYNASEKCDVMLVVGTSGIVAPASHLPQVTRRAGGIVIEINPDETAISHLATIRLQGPSGEILPRIMEALGDG